ncbi:MAG: hypothetical protein V3V82_00295 [Acidimicrobiia bacterium]
MTVRGCQSAVLSFTQSLALDHTGQHLKKVLIHDRKSMRRAVAASALNSWRRVRSCTVSTRTCPFDRRSSYRTLTRDSSLNTTPTGLAVAAEPGRLALGAVGGRSRPVRLAAATWFSGAFIALVLS